MRATWGPGMLEELLGRGDRAPEQQAELLLSARSRPSPPAGPLSWRPARARFTRSTWPRPPASTCTPAQPRVGAARCIACAGRGGRACACGALVRSWEPGQERARLAVPPAPRATKQPRVVHAWCSVACSVCSLQLLLCAVQVRLAVLYSSGTFAVFDLDQSNE